MKVALVIVTEGDKITRVFQEAKIFLKYFKKMKRLYPNGNFFTVNRTHASPPPTDWERYAFNWCPYCGAERNFVYVDLPEVKQCVVCGITENNYYVKKFN